MLLRVLAYAGFAKRVPNFWGSGRVSYREGFGCILTVIFFKWCILKHIFIFIYLKTMHFGVYHYILLKVDLNNVIVARCNLLCFGAMMTFDKCKFCRKHVVHQLTTFCVKSKETYKCNLF